MATIASRAPEVALGVAVKGEAYFVGTSLSPAEQFLKKTQQVDPSKPETIIEALKVGAATGVSAPHMMELETRNNIMGSGDIKPDGTKNPRIGDELARHTKAEDGKHFIETFRNYSDPTTPSDKINDLKDRAISVITARPNGNTALKGRTPAEKQAEADTFIKDNYKRLSKSSDEDIKRIMEDPSQNPVTTSEAVLQAQLQHNDAEFAQKAADDALQEAGTYKDKLKDDYDDFYGTTPGIQGKKLETLEGEKSGRLSTIEQKKSIIRAIEDQRSNDLRSLSDLHAKYGYKTIKGNRYGGGTATVTADPEILEEIKRLEQNLKDYNDPTKTNNLATLIDDLTKEQIKQQEYETLLKRKNDLPAERAKANEDVLRFTKEKTNAEAALKKAKEAVYYANQTRATAELKYSESVNKIFDNAINKVIDENLDAITPNLAKTLTVEAQHRIAKMEEKLTKKYQIIIPEKRFLWKVRKEEIKWNGEQIRQDMEKMIHGTDLDLDNFITTNNLIDNYGDRKRGIPYFSEVEKAQMRALVATSLVDTNCKINHEVPDDTQLFELAQKEWIDQLHILNLKNNPNYVARLEKEFPDEEITEDNVVLTSKVKRNLILDGSLVLLLFGLSKASTENKENKQ